ncbi:unnamed protein product [Rotaria sp. Silwood2]|nr:unnamed protein product [Rotaria sp. Silwood2]CAF2840305.1 unnamed protein product [Rotaria sp. Silwood2]CAF3075415.1 unnamed protein product [Rotaria sp. Silwood2]CAF4467913.1 unnamed protein product [Rotaria sp. Silwood2]CAF4490040.1 unnamed protein product [Rotaria sp. Silwood2]
MPPKRSTLLGRNTSAANRMAASRDVESPEHRQNRLDDQHSRQAASRAAESPEQTRTQLGDQRSRQVVARVTESP